MPEPDYKTIRELGRIFNLNPKTVTYRLKAAGIKGKQLTKFKVHYFDINEVQEFLTTPLIREAANNDPEMNTAAVDAGEKGGEINYTFEPINVLPDRAGQILTVEFMAALTEFFGFEGAQNILINNYGLKPWKVA